MQALASEPRGVSGQHWSGVSGGHYADTFIRLTFPAGLTACQGARNDADQSGPAQQGAAACGQGASAADPSGPVASAGQAPLDLGGPSKLYDAAAPFEVPSDTTMASTSLVTLDGVENHVLHVLVPDSKAVHSSPVPPVPLKTSLTSHPSC